MYQQQASLPGAYNAPPAYYDSQRLGSNLIRCLLWTIIAVGSVFALVGLVVWVVFRGTKIDVAVDAATLSDFDLTVGSLSYNLTADITIGNPNKWVGVYYDWLEAGSYYRGARFDLTPLPTFFQGHKTSTMLHLAVTGSHKPVALGSSDVDRYNRDVILGGVFRVDLWIVGRVRYKFVFANHKTLEVKCPLTIRLNPPGTEAIIFFRRTACK